MEWMKKLTALPIRDKPCMRSPIALAKVAITVA
jgi:hypothetical protein